MCWCVPQVRLAHRVKELDELPENLNKMSSINRVKEWYAQSFEVRAPSLHTLSPSRL
jgi:pyruvate dehydrogenase kinase 2/3/4